MIKDMEKLESKYGQILAKAFTPEVIALVFEKLKELGIENVEVRYEGGHDSGCVEDIEFNTNGKNNYYYDNMQTEYPNLVEILCDPVYQHYSSFAFEMNVQGLIIWKEGRILIEGTETSENDISSLLYEPVMPIQKVDPNCPF